MVTKHLDLDEQEQVAALKYFWSKYGVFILVLLGVLGVGYAAWTGWNWYQTDLEKKSALRFDELNTALVAGDTAKADAVFADMKQQVGATSYTAQAALLNARMHYGKNDMAAAQAALQWLIDSSAESLYRDIARLRLASLMIEAKQYDAAIKMLNQDVGPAFAPLAQDRIGDAYSLQKKFEEAKTHYQKAYKTMLPTSEYRQMIEVKLTQLGVAVKDEK